MKRNSVLLLLLIIIMGIACKKDNPVYKPISLLVGNDTARVLLKDMISERLPSPYYHFVYDAKKYATEIDFADQLVVYKLTYENKRLKQMLNQKNGNHLDYTYVGNLVSLITEYAGNTGKKRWDYLFTYNKNFQLQQIKWVAFPGAPATGVLYRKVVFTYYADGNLYSFDNFFADTTGKLTWSSRNTYKDYDKGTNVDDFSLVKNFFESLLYLPSVKLQKNNPRTEIITSITNDYDIRYDYQYHNGLPVTKTGTVTQTRGSGNSKPVKIVDRFSYY